jgi:hypothetical protein
MPATILSDLDGLLKRHYAGNFIAGQQQFDPDFINTMPLGVEKMGGEDAGFRFGVNLQRAQSGGAQNQNETFRSNQTAVRKQAVVSAKINIWAIELTGFAITMSKSQVDAFVSGLEDEFQDKLTAMKKDMNRQVFGQGNGVLTQVNGGVTASLTITVDSVQYLFPGMRLDIWTAVGGTKEASAVQISSFNETTLVVTLAQAVTVSNNALIVREGILDSAPTEGKEMMGLLGHSDDASLFVTYQGLSRSSYTAWQGSITDASSATLTNDLLQRAMDKGERRSGRVSDTIISHRNQRRGYLNLTTPLKRFQDDNLDSGFKALEWNGMRWMVSHDCQRDKVYIYPRKDLERFEAFGIKLDDTEGSTIHRIARTDTFEAYYKHYGNTGSKYPAAINRLDNLATLAE